MIVLCMSSLCGHVGGCFRRIFYLQKHFIVFIKKEKLEKPDFVGVVICCCLRRSHLPVLCFRIESDSNRAVASALTAPYYVHFSIGSAHLWKKPKHSVLNAFPYWGAHETLVNKDSLIWHQSECTFPLPNTNRDAPCFGFPPLLNPEG